MLIDINLRPNYVKDTIMQRRKLLSSLNSNSSNRKFIEKSIENTLSIKGVEDLFTRYERGIYKGIVYDSYLENLTGLNFVPYKKGIADDIQQILLYFKELKNNNEKFVVIFDKLTKSIKTPTDISGNELYIGNYNIKEELIFKRAIYFNIFILKEEAQVS